jgi:hypothetical protein
MIDTTHPHQHPLDERDSALLAARIGAWNEGVGPRVGDFLELPDGTMLRFTHDYGEGIQTTCRHASGSFYFGVGYMSYSGPLDPPVDKAALEDTYRTHPGRAWFFHHDYRTAHNGVYVHVECRVFRTAEPDPVWPE